MPVEPFPTLLLFYKALKNYKPISERENLICHNIFYFIHAPQYESVVSKLQPVKLFLALFKMLFSERFLAILINSFIHSFINESTLLNPMTATFLSLPGNYFGEKSAQLWPNL